MVGERERGREERRKEGRKEEARRGGIEEEAMQRMDGVTAMATEREEGREEWNERSMRIKND